MYRNMAADFVITPEDVSEEYIAQSKILLVSGTALAASPSREACLMAINYAKSMVQKLFLILTIVNTTGEVKQILLFTIL